MEIIPAILTNNSQELQEKIALVEGLVKRVQIDVIDGVFANNKTVALEALENTDAAISLDIHLMVKNPIDWVEKSVRTGADRIIGQVEIMEDQIGYVAKLAEVGKEIGLALDLETPVSAIDQTILKDLDVVLVMSVKAGFGGQDFQSDALEKVKELSENRASLGLNYRICVDGGVNSENIKQIADAGADQAVVGHALYDGGVEENMNKLTEAIK